MIRKILHCQLILAGNCVTVIKYWIVTIYHFIFHEPMINAHSNHISPDSLPDDEFVIRSKKTDHFYQNAVEACKVSRVENGVCDQFFYLFKILIFITLAIYGLNFIT